jgi:hypothetical protein
MAIGAPNVYDGDRNNILKNFKISRKHHRQSMLIIYIGHFAQVLLSTQIRFNIIGCGYTNLKDTI